MPVHPLAYVRPLPLLFYAEPGRPGDFPVRRKIIRYRHTGLDHVIRLFLGRLSFELFFHTSIINPGRKLEPVEFYLFFR